MINLQITDNALAHANSALRKILTDSPKAVARAVNRTMEGLRTDAVKETRKKYFVSAKDVRASISFRKANAGNLMGAMVSKGKRHSLADYKLTPNTPKPGGKTVLKGAVKTDGGLKELRKAFLVKRAGGRYVPFYRLHSGAGSSNQYRHKGIRAFISPSMPQIIKNKETVEVMEKGAEQRFSKRLNHEILQLFGALP